MAVTPPVTPCSPCNEGVSDQDAQQAWMQQDSATLQSLYAEAQTL